MLLALLSTGLIEGKLLLLVRVCVVHHSSVASGDRVWVAYRRCSVKDHSVAGAIRDQHRIQNSHSAGKIIILGFSDDRSFERGFLTSGSSMITVSLLLRLSASRWSSCFSMVPFRILRAHFSGLRFLRLRLRRLEIQVPFAFKSQQCKKMYNGSAYKSSLLLQHLIYVSFVRRRRLS